MRELLFPLRWIYQFITGFRNWLYDRSIFRARAVSSKVISIGNITVGGTGKTPVTLALIDLVKSKNFTCGVVSRGYKRGKKGIHPVVTGGSAAQDFGDEPVLIKTLHPEVPVFVGEKRVKTAQKLLDSEAVDFIFCDDAFQHRAIKRDLNLLLLDSTEPMKSYRVMPVGRGRESLLPALKRVDYFVLTKTNLCTVDELKDLICWVKGNSEKPVLLAAYEFKGFRNVKGELVLQLKDSAYLVTGVAKPWTVEMTIDGHVKTVKHKTFADHHRYTHLEVETILDEASHLQARWIVTTAKDATKLSQFPGLKDRLWVIDLGVQFEGDLKLFYADVDRLARARD